MFFSMEKHLSQSGQDDEQQELRILLRSLLVEATPEACFEERFLYDFRERVVRETVCRSTRSLLWEQVVMFMDRVGIRRIALGASTFSLGALCAGVWIWQQGGSSSPAIASVAPCALEESARSLRPGDAQGVVGTTVQRVSPRRRSSAFFTALAEEEDATSLSDEWSNPSSLESGRFSGRLHTETGSTSGLRF